MSKKAKALNTEPLEEVELWEPGDPEQPITFDELLTRSFAFDKNMNLVRPEFIERSDKMIEERKARKK